jgi:hypothetical protein
VLRLTKLALLPLFILPMIAGCAGLSKGFVIVFEGSEEKGVVALGIQHVSPAVVLDSAFISDSTNTVVYSFHADTPGVRLDKVAYLMTKGRLTMGGSYTLHLYTKQGLCVLQRRAVREVVE